MGSAEHPWSRRRLPAEGRYDQSIGELEGARASLDADTGVWIDLLIAESALAGDRAERAEQALAGEAFALPNASPIVQAQATRFRARIAASREDAEHAEDGFKQAAAAFREYGTPFYLACTELEHAEWLVSVGRGGDAARLVPAARETFERLRATPWLERAAALAAQLPALTIA